MLTTPPIRKPLKDVSPLAALLWVAAASDCHIFKRFSNFGSPALKHSAERLSAAELPAAKILRRIPFPARYNIKSGFSSCSDTVVDRV